MKCLIVSMVLLIISENVTSQVIDTIFLIVPHNRDTITYKRIVEFDIKTKLYHVRDYYENGQIQMDATYSKLDKYFKEKIQCNYHSNTKQGLYRTWYKNGQLDSRCSFIDGMYL